MNTEILDSLKKAVYYAGRSTADEWPGIVEADDIEQEIWIRLLESPGSAEKLADMNDRDRRISLNKIGRQLAIEERSSYELFSSQVRYSSDDVREMLEAGALVGAGFVFADERMDFEIAISDLRDTKANYVEYLWARYEDGTYSTETGAAWERLGRAVRKLTVHMNMTSKIRNENYEGPGSRRVTTNAEARYASNNSWEAPVV